MRLVRQKERHRTIPHRLPHDTPPVGWLKCEAWFVSCLLSGAIGIIGGGIFLRDGSSYLGLSWRTMDRDYSQYFPSWPS